MSKRFVRAAAAAAAAGILIALWAAFAATVHAQAAPDDTMADSAAATAAEARPAADAGLFIALDFGSPATIAPFKANTGGHGVIFSGNVKFAAEAEGPDPVLIDYAAADYLTLIDLRTGVYRVALVAQNVVIGMVPGRDFSVTANGVKVIDEKVPPRAFFSERGIFHGIQFEDLPPAPGEDEAAYWGANAWGRYVEPVAPWRVFEVECDGRLRLELDGARLFALVAAPAAEVSEERFRAFLAEAQAARRKHFLTNRFAFTAAPVPAEVQATPQEVERGYIVFSRYMGDDVGYRDLPAEGERVTRLELAGAPGERVPATLSVHALKNLSGTSVYAGELKSNNGATIPADAVEVLAVRLKLRATGQSEAASGDGPRRRIHEVAPAVLQRQPYLNIPAGLTKRWWITVKIPSGAAPGVYSGTITVASKDLPALRLPLRVEVYPFMLAQPASSIGLFYEDPALLGYSTRLAGGVGAVWPAPYLEPHVERAIAERDREVEAYRVAMVEADLKCIAERGFNGITMPLPRVVSVSQEGRVELDFALLEAYRALLVKYGLNTVFAGQTHLLGVGRQIASVGAGGRKIEEYSALHAAAYKDAYAQMVRWYDDAGIKMLAYVVDEPRERNINPWNRNMEGTLYYLRLVNEVGGWPSTVTTMADDNNAISYAPLHEEEDVVQPHPGTRNVLAVQYARRTGKPLRYFNGSGFLRYPYGFFIWSQAPEGYWQWHYQFWGIAFNPVWESDGGHAVYPGPDGPLSTPKFERAAAGIVDYRYALTLEDYITRARASGNADAAAAAEEARGRLNAIRAECVPYVLDDAWGPLGVSDATLVGWKEEIVRHILALHGMVGR